MKKNSELSHVDLFCGAGGICTGFKAAGIKTVVAVDSIKSCRDTYNKNHPEVEFILKDIRHVSDSEIKTLAAKRGAQKVDIVTAGFPCETFSTAGAKSRVYNDHRNFLFREAIRIASALEARVLLLENVPAFLSKRIQKDSDVRVLDILLTELREAGYKFIDHTIINAAEYGVPQRRNRFILLASKNLPVTKELITGGKFSNKVSVGEALSDLPLIPADSSSSEYRTAPMNTFQRLLRNPRAWGAKSRKTTLSYHISPKHRPGTLKRFEYIRPGEGLRDIFTRLGAKVVKRLQAERILPAKWYIQRNQRLILNSQAHTVTSHCLEEMVHPTLNRALSIREVARLQSFPDHYNFIGGPIIAPHIYRIQDKYEQIGDAVPPLLAKHLANSLLKFFKNS